MVRIAQANGFKVHTFYAEHFGQHRQIWTRDIDHLAPDWLLQGLAERTGADANAIEATTLRSMAGFAFEDLNDVGASRWVLPVGVYHRTRRRHGMQFCPVCLVTDQIPFLRLTWRLGVSTICTRHGVWLACSCPSCGRALAPHRADVQIGRGSHAKSSLRYCGHCRADLGSEVSEASEADVELQRHLDGVLERGLAVVDGQPIYSHLYFDGIRMLMQGLARLSLPSGEPRRVFELMPATTRMRWLRAAAEEVQDWPLGFSERCRKRRRPYTTFVRDGDPHPWWVWSVLRREFYSAVAPISKAEATGVLDAVERWTGLRSEMHARRLFGRHVRSDSLPLPATEAEIETVIACIDHAISEAGPKERALLLRDNPSSTPTGVSA